MLFHIFEQIYWSISGTALIWPQKLVFGRPNGPPSICRQYQTISNQTSIAKHDGCYFTGLCHRYFVEKVFLLKTQELPPKSHPNPRVVHRVWSNLSLRQEVIRKSVAQMIHKNPWPSRGWVKGVRIDRTSAVPYFRADLLIHTGFLWCWRPCLPMWSRPKHIKPKGHAPCCLISPLG